jgi:predicted membrane-bound spermidine synthase
MAGLLYLAFLASGIAGLIYETIWSRYLGLLLGHSAYAQVIVLVVFLGGMAAGAALVGRRSERRRRPWLDYAIVEIVIGLFGLAFHSIYTAASAVAYDSIFPALEGGLPLMLAKWAIAAVLILPQSILLGMTFPLMSAEVLRRFPATPGRVLALLYFTNGLGGAFGVLLSGFWLVGRAGLGGSLAVAGVMNIAIGLLVAAAAGLRRPAPVADLSVQPLTPFAAPPASSALPPAATTTLTLPRLRTVLLAVSAGTAIASFIYEIAWIRMLSLVLGGATHAFELMLSAFILGLALGAFWVRTRIDRFEDPLRALAVVQWTMGALALATLPVYLASFQWTASLLGALNMTPEGYAVFTIARYAIALLVMLPATFCAGITLPLITRTLLRGGAGEAAVGTVYAANTIGSVVGVSLAALLLMPLIGLKALLITGAALDMALGIWLLGLSPWRLGARRQVLAAAAACTVLLVAGIAWQARFDRTLLSSGVFRARRLLENSGQEILHYRDGRTATVSAAIEHEATVLIATNGKVDASLPTEWLEPPALGAKRIPLTRDVATQVLLPVLTLAHAPNARSAAVIGQGSGMSSHFLLGSPHLERVTTIEIEPEMIEGSKIFHPANKRVFEDPRSHFAIEDARAFFAAGNTRYDLILSEPSNPWVSGVSSLFTKEFYAQVDRHLSPNGVFGQWIHLYEIDDGLILGILAALHERFPSYALYYTAPNDMLIVASRQDSLPAPDWSVLRFPGIEADLRRVVPITAQTLDVLRAGGRATFGPLLDREITANSDFEPLLDLGAERGRYLSETAVGFASLSSARFNMIAALERRRIPLATETWTATPEIEVARATTLSARLRASDTVMLRDDERDAEIAGALYRKRTLEAMLARDEPPADWALWFRTVTAVEQELHGPAAGHADEKFYGSLLRYLDRAKAPAIAVASAQLMHGLAAWDFPAASRAADKVMADPSFGTGWVPHDMLRDGGVVAKLMTGDVAGARRLYDRLTSAGETDLKSRILGAYILAAARD